MSRKLLYILCSILICIALFLVDIILMLLALAVVVISLTDAWWRQEVQRMNRFSDKWSLSIQPVFQNVPRGTRETLICHVYDLPDHTQIINVSWFFNQHDSNYFSQLSLDSKTYSSGSNENPSMTINNFQPDDEGTYMCEIENDVGLKKVGSAYLAFTEKPTPETFPINKDCSKNSTQTVSCYVRGTQPKNVQWVKVSKGTAKSIQISSSGDKYSVGTAERPSLHIKNFVMDDEGTYVCCAVNDAGIGSSKGTFLTYILDASDHQNREDSFHRLVTLVHIAGDVTKNYFDSCVLKADTFGKYLEKNIHNILHLHEPHPCCKCSFKCCKCTKACSCRCKCKCFLTRDQISLLFAYDKQLFNRRHTRFKDGSNQHCMCPYKVKSSASLSVVDITLMSVIIANDDGMNIHLGVDKKFEDIRKARNYVFHQSDSQSLEEQAFERKWKILKESTEYFLQFIIDEKYKENIIKKINETRISIRISSDSFVQQKIFLEFWRDKCAELEQRHQEEFRQSFSRFQQIIMDEDTLMEPAMTSAAKIEELQTVVNEVVVQVFGNDELKNILKSTDDITSDEGQGTMSVLLQIDVPDFWDEKDITKAFREIQATQMNKEAAVKIKSYSYKNLNIIIDVLKHIMNDIHELHHEVLPLISGFLSYIDTKEKADVNLKMIAPEKLKLEIRPLKKKVINEYSHTIECIISGKPSPFIIKWTKKNQEEEIVIGALQEKYSGGTIECPSLTIKCFVKDDEGVYICRATNEAGVGLSNESKLTYIEKPKVNVSPDRQNVVKGRAQTLTCSVSGNPSPIISWMRENNGTEAIINLPSEKYTGGNVGVPSLTIIDFNQDDEGIYVCTATNEAGEAVSNKSILIYVEPPTVVVSPYRQSVVKGKAQTLMCSVSGKPPPNVSWMRVINGAEAIITLHSGKYIGRNADVPSLTIIDFNQDDEGIYVCKATNEAGEAVSNKSILQYIEPPTVIVSPEKQSVVKGKAQTLMCSVSGKPPPIVSWMRVNDGAEAIINLPSEKYTGGNADVPSLTIIDFNQADEGIYVCKATNEAGEAVSSLSHLTYIENVQATEEAFALAETPAKYNFPVSVTLRQQLQVKMPGYELGIMDCIKIGNKLVFADFYGSKLITCNANGTDERHIPLQRKPWHITEIDSDTVAVSCEGRTIGIINISTDKLINSIETHIHCRAISYDDNTLYVVIDEGIIREMNLTGIIKRSFTPSPSKRIVDVTVKGKMLVCLYETSIYRCSVDGKIVWKFENEKYQSLNSVTTDEKDNIYVTDLKSNTVFVLSDDGKYYKELQIESDELNRTSVIYFDRNENVLLACNKGSGKAFLFDIKHPV